jgi:hypothetical protein
MIIGSTRFYSNAALQILYSSSTSAADASRSLLLHLAQAPVAFRQIKNLLCLIRRCDFATEFAGDPHHLFDQLGARSGVFAGADERIVFHAHANMTTLGDDRRHEFGLITSSPQDADHATPESGAAGQGLGAQRRTEGAWRQVHDASAEHEYDEPRDPGRSKGLR